ncbi:MAG TPA: hypothetical protein PKA55_01775 [Rhodoblastus sp.]|nr:hypothetical protein [Rhodoblastus sp.]
MNKTIYKVFAGSTADRTHAASAAIIEKNGKIEGEARARVLPGATNPYALLDGYALGLSGISTEEAKDADILCVCTTPWIVELANQHIASLLDNYAGVTAAGRDLANIEAWERLRKEALRLGGLPCDSGRVRFVALSDLHDKLHIENARRQAKRTRKVAQRKAGA